MVVLKCLTNIIALNYIENSEAKSQIITLLESYSIPFNWSADVNPVMISGLNGTWTRPGVAELRIRVLFTPEIFQVCLSLLLK